MQALCFNSTELDKHTKGGGNESINARQESRTNVETTLSSKSTLKHMDYHLLEITGYLPVCNLNVWNTFPINILWGFLQRRI